MAKQFTLGKEERLKSRKQTEQLFSAGKKYNLTPYRVHYLFNQTTSPSLQFGTGVSSKIFKKATDRNRIKRLVREVYRLQKNLLQEKLKEQECQLTIFFIYTGRELPGYPDLYEKMGKVLQKFQNMIPLKL